MSLIFMLPDSFGSFCHQLLLSGETQYQSKPELLPGLAVGARVFLSQGVTAVVHGC